MAAGANLLFLHFSSAGAVPGHWPLHTAWWLTVAKHAGKPQQCVLADLPHSPRAAAHTNVVPCMQMWRVHLTRRKPPSGAIRYP